MKSEGVNVAAIVDLRAEREESAAARRVRIARHSRLAGRLRPTRRMRGGDGTVAALDGRAARCRPAASTPPSARRIECDAVLMSVGWAAATQLLVQAGATTRFCEELQQFVPKDLPAGVFAAGRLNGVVRFRRADRRREAGGLARRPRTRASAQRRARAAVARSDRRPSHPFPDHRSSARQELRRLRRGSAGQRPGERGAGGFRFERAPEALQHRGHGPLPGQTLAHECLAHPGARPRRWASSSWV